MKKSFLSIIVLLLCFSFLLASCVEDEINESGESSLTASSMADASANNSSESKKPWYDTTVPENYVSQVIDASAAFSEVESEASSEVADESSTESDDLSSGILDAEGSVTDSPNRAASNYRIAYTKESALDATDCITNVAMSTPITAIYDGSVTRFFHAITGDFYHATPGKYLFPCCEGFLAGDSQSVNGNYAVMFDFDDNGEPVISNTHFGHGGFGIIYDIYSETNGCAYEWWSDMGEVSFERYTENDLVICREYLIKQNVETAFENGDLSIEEAHLGKYGLVKNDDIIIPFEYDYMVTVYGSNDVGVVLAQKDGRSYYLSTNGDNLTPDGFDCGSQPFKNRAWVFEDGQGYILEFR